MLMLGVNKTHISVGKVEVLRT